MVNSVCIIAGEPSGDLYAGRVVAELRKKNPALDIFGIGGDNMISNGLHALYHINQLSFMGIVEVVKNLSLIKEVLNNVTEEIKRKRPDVLVLVDYPGFNLKLLEKVRNYCKKIIYFISPQLWAWGKGRIKKIQKNVDEMLVIFPFEQEFYNKENVNALFVGHPLVEILDEKIYASREDFFRQSGFDLSKKLIAVFPGSRLQEIKKHLPVIEETILRLKDDFDVNIGIAVSPSIGNEVFKSFIGMKNIALIDEYRHNLLNNADLAVIKSGTSTIETALFKVPMVIFYKTSWLNYNLGKHFVKIESFGMANIIAGKKIIPELLQHEVTSKNIINWCSKMINDGELVKRMKEDLSVVKQKLGGKGATERVSDIILNIC
jgi:lipid-A-disaccharide synthase